MSRIRILIINFEPVFNSLSGIVFFHWLCILTFCLEDPQNENVLFDMLVRFLELRCNQMPLRGQIHEEFIADHKLVWASNWTTECQVYSVRTQETSLWRNLVRIYRTLSTKAFMYPFLAKVPGGLRDYGRVRLRLQQERCLRQIPGKIKRQHAIIPMRSRLEQWSTKAEGD